MNKKYHRYIPIILFLIFGFYYNYYTPLWTPPDEERHFAYCDYIAQHHTVPYLDPQDEGLHITEATHPPLFYMLGSLFCKKDGQTIHEQIILNDGPGYAQLLNPPGEEKFPYAGKARSAYLIRLLSIVFSAITIYFIYMVALTIFPGETTLATASALFIAVNPQFIHISASVSNESLSSMLSTMLLFTLLRYLQGHNTRKHQVIIGILLGCDLLTKISTIIYVPVTCLVIMGGFFRTKKDLLVALLITFSSAFFISGWWYLRNWLLFNDPVFSNALITLLPFTRRINILTANSISDLIIMFTSFFGYFGALQISISAFHVGMYVIITVLGAVGMCRLFLRRLLNQFQMEAIELIFFTLLCAIGLILVLNLKAYVFSGKYFFIVVAPIALFFCLGFCSLFPVQCKNAALIILMLLLVILNLDIVVRVLKPAYIRPRVVEYIDQPKFCCRTDVVTATTTIGQTFISPQDNLSAIRIMFANPGRLSNGKITFVLREGGSNGRLLEQIDLSIKNVHNSRFFFIFPPIKNSAGKRYSFSFHCPSQTEYGISLWYSSADCYTDGHMFKNDEPSSGDLFFTAYGFTGDYPRTDWEGIKAAVIRQEEYISVRELQLYVEMSRELKEKVPTHAKLLHLKQFMIK
jgi:4-amino-4-deoxy-L-arabinose transferase-like glycosyltransferase